MRPKIQTCGAIAIICIITSILALNPQPTFAIPIPTTSIILTKQTDPETSTQAFLFEIMDPYGNITEVQLHNGETSTTIFDYIPEYGDIVPSMIFVVTEQPVLDWHLDNININSSSGGTASIISGGFQWIIGDEQVSSIYVTFENRFVGASIPEPATILLFVSGLIGLTVLKRRFKKS